MDLDPQSHWSRIQSGSGSTTLFFFYQNDSFPDLNLPALPWVFV
jgi:hypothetical protein